MACLKMRVSYIGLRDLACRFFNLTKFVHHYDSSMILIYDGSGDVVDRLEARKSNVIGSFGRYAQVVPLPVSR